MSELTEHDLATRRLKACVELWPGCESGMYDPRCCRFPKSCSPHGRIEAVRAGNLADWDLEPTVETIGVLRPNTYTDPLERLLELVTDTIDGDDLCIGYGGNDPIVPKWYIYAYWYAPGNAPPEDGRWEIEATGPTLRAVLAQVVGHPRFGQ